MSDIVYDITHVINHEISAIDIGEARLRLSYKRYNYDDFKFKIENDFTSEVLHFFNKSSIIVINLINSISIYEFEIISIDNIHYDITCINPDIEQQITDIYKYLDEIKYICEQYYMHLIINKDDDIRYSSKYNDEVLLAQTQTISKVPIQQLQSAGKCLCDELNILKNYININCMISEPNIDNLCKQCKLTIKRISSICNETDSFNNKVKQRILAEHSMERARVRFNHIGMCYLCVVYIILLSVIILAIIY